jgi:hypothetical protein
MTKCSNSDSLRAAQQADLQEAEGVWASMFMQRTRIMPILGDGPEVRVQLTDWAKQGQSKGRRIALGQRLFSTEGPAFIVVTVADDLAGLDKIRQENAADADFQSRFARLAPLLAEVPRTIVLERLLAPSMRHGTPISQLASFPPATGASQAVRQKLEGFVRDRQGSGVTIALWQRVFSSDGPSFSTLSRYADLAELDKHRQGGRQAVVDLSLALGGQLRAAPQIRITETIVPLPS